MLARDLGHGVIKFLRFCSTSQRPDSSSMPWGSLKENPMIATDSMALIFADISNHVDWRGIQGAACDAQITL